MISKDYLTVLAQTHSGWVFDEGTQVSQKQVLGVDKIIGLLAMSSASEVTEDGAAHMALKILLDDMQVNLPMAASQIENTQSPASACLFESLDNINEFLFNEYHDTSNSEQSAVTLSAIQFSPGQMSLMLGKGIVALHMHEGTIKRLGEGSKVSEKLGISSAFKTQIYEQAVENEDMVMILPQQMLQKIEQEFLRVTLSRFGDNLAMALRQINTRAARQGMSFKPAVILARIEKIEEKQGGWLNRFGKG